MADIEVKIEGMEEILRNLAAPHVLPATKNRMKRAALAVEVSAKDNMRTTERGKTASNTGATLSSLTSTVEELGSDIVGIVGSKRKTARWMEFGTGLLSEDPRSSKKRHWPPAAALEEWARRHGFESGAIVAHIIGRRGGLKPRRFLRDAFESNRQTIIDELSHIPQDVAEMLVKR